MMFRILVLLVTVVATCTAQGDQRMKSREGYVKIDNLGYYKLELKMNLTWGDARKACQDDNTHLAIVNSRREQYVLLNMTKNAGIEVAYLGFHDLFTLDDWVTIFGLPLNDTGYQECSLYYTTYSGQCGTMDPGGVSNFECAVPRAYICEKELWTDYEYLPELGYYKLHTEKKTWNEAYTQCELEGADLAIIKSKAEQKALIKLLEKENIDIAAVGFHSLFLVGEYITIKGKPLDTGYVHWAPNQPANTETDRCGGLAQEGLSNVDCSQSVPFICKHCLE